MTLSLIGLAFLIILFLGYGCYGNFVINKLGLNSGFVTPAHKKNDGNDFVPTNPFYLFGQHFSAIAAAGPIAGPIMACSVWGFLPCILWILLGVILIGAVHDFLSLFASVRHGAVSIAEITKEHLGKNAGLAMVVFIWLSLIYVIVSFTDITASSFVGKSEELDGVHTLFNPGGAVAMAATLYLFIAMIMGITERLFHPPLWLSTLIFVPLTFFSVWLGTKFSTVLIFDAKIWCLFILIYCFISSLLPVWFLLQPRGYLGGFILYTAIAIGIIGIFSGNYDIKQPAFVSFDVGTPTGMLFPFLFVTIACGACSGFHGLVCSGTTSKQIDKEAHIKLIGYGAMLCEALVAFIALSTVMIWSKDDIASLKPAAIYGKGLGEFLTLVIGKEYLHFAITFGAMAFSTFVFDTLDVATRLGRYLLQEVFNQKTKTGAVITTLATMALPAVFVMIADQGSYLSFWSLFGASNQLLAALSLLSITLWLYQAKKRIAFTLLPMLFVLCITGSVLVKMSYRSLYIENTSGLSVINGLVAISLIALALYLVLKAVVSLKTKRSLLENKSIDPA